VVPLHLTVAALIGWLQREQQEVIAYLREENRALKAQLRHQRVRLTDDERRRFRANVFVATYLIAGGYAERVRKYDATAM
jgi:hypothetical protein